MIRTSKPIRIVILVFACVVLLGNLPADAFDKGVDFSKVKLTSPDPDDERYIETEIDGITPKNPRYFDGSIEQEMYPATEAYICINDPNSDPNSIPNNCRKVITSTFGAAWNTWVCWGGRWFYIAP